MRALIRLFGLGTLLFGIGPTLAPRWFGRLFDLPVSSDERLLVMVRSVGVRDATIGLALVLTAPRPGAYRPWLIARCAADARARLCQVEGRHGPVSYWTTMVPRIPAGA